MNMTLPLESPWRKEVLKALSDVRLYTPSKLVEKAFKNIPFIHFLSAGKLSCMCFLMAMEEEPVRSLSSVIAAMIPVLYDMVEIVLI